MPGSLECSGSLRSPDSPPFTSSWDAALLFLPCAKDATDEAGDGRSISAFCAGSEVGAERRS
jgi:hypothetical protein